MTFVVLSALTDGTAGARPGPGHVTSSASTSPSAAPSSASVQAAYGFLDLMMDNFATGSTLRLVQSFTVGVLGQQNFTDSETYDDALIIDAYLAEGTEDALARAKVVGDSLLYVQAHDPKHDGRIREAYAPKPLTSPSQMKVADKTVSDLS